MPVAPQDAVKLRKIIKLAEELLADDTRAKSASKDGRATKAAAKPSERRRRTGQELTRFRKALRAERKRGVPVAEIARSHGVSSSYIYQLD